MQQASSELTGRTREPDPVVAAFTRQLQRALEAAGHPRPKRLFEISETLPGKTLIIKQTLHDNLKGSRLTLPRWDWVSAYINTLRIAAKETGLDPAAVGTITDWWDRYRAADKALTRARHAARLSTSTMPTGLPHLTITVTTEPVEDPLPSSATSRQVVQGPAGDEGLSTTVPLDISALFAREDADDTSEPELPQDQDPPRELRIGLGLPGTTQPRTVMQMSTAEWAQRRLDHGPLRSDDHADVFGEHGPELLRAAHRGDGEASCRLGILLICHDLDPHAAMRWLGNAAQREEPMAIALLNADPTVRRALAASFALDLTLPTGNTAADALLAPTGTTSKSPALYYEAAVTAGTKDVAGHAADRLGRLHEAQGNTGLALHWYTTAADHGFPGAQARWNNLRYRTDTNRIANSTSPRTP